VGVLIASLASKRAATRREEDERAAGRT
jgi:hypothetical protein